MLLLIGSPGSGKSMLARRLPSILTDMTRQESLPDHGGVLRGRDVSDPSHPW